MSCEADHLQDLCVACGIFSPVTFVKSACLESCTLRLTVSVPVPLPCLQGLLKMLLQDHLLVALHGCSGALEKNLAGFLWLCMENIARKRNTKDMVGSKSATHPFKWPPCCSDA